MSKINQTTIQGFKSIQQLESFKLTNLNVLIGGNGVDKNNIIVAMVIKNCAKVMTWYAVSVQDG